MRAVLGTIVLAAGLIVSLGGYAEAPATAPAGTTGLCKDGSYYSGATKKGACAKHGGVKEWYGAKETKTAAAKTPATAKTPAAESKSTQGPAVAPAGATGLCKDGSYYSGATKKGACAKHGGVKEWYGAKETKPAAAPAPAASTPAASAPAASTPPASTPAASTRSAAPTKEVPASTKTAAPKSEATPAPGGGSGKVWVNTNSKVYHCEGTRWYGKTKSGEYMSEAAAKAAGNRPDHGKGCS